MPEFVENSAIELEKKRLMTEWEGWQPILVQFESLLAWKRPADPGIIFGATTLVFLIFWYLDPSVLTTVAALGLIFTLLDFLMPTLSAQFFKTDKDANKKWETICRALASKKLSAASHWRCFLSLRHVQPKKFYAVTIATLFILSWIGNSVSNILLSYIVLLAFLMVPGVNRRGWLDPITKLLPSCCKKPETVKKD